MNNLERFRGKQAWYIKTINPPPLRFVGITEGKDTDTASRIIQDHLEFSRDSLEEYTSFGEAINFLRDKLDDQGVLVMSHSTKKEIKSFSLLDKRAPLIFINNRISRAEMLYLLLYEIAHVFFGKDGDNTSFHAIATRLFPNIRRAPFPAMLAQRLTANFAGAVIERTRSGDVTYRDAYSLLDVNNKSVFDKFDEFLSNWSRGVRK